MRKFSATLLIGFLFLEPLNASAAVKAGATCSKLGATSTYAGKKYTCIKSGKRLVWDKGVAIPKPVPTVSPTPTATVAPSSTPTPAPILTKTPTGFGDLVDSFKGVYISVWNSSDAKIKRSLPVDVKQNILFGPNTKSPSSEISKMFSRATQFFSGYAQPTSFDAIYYVFDDIPWASQKLLELYGNPDQAQAPSRNCQSRQRCNGASANVPKTNIGQANFAVLDGGHLDPYHLQGGIEIHEYTHMVQFMQFQGKPTYQQQGGFALLPNWFVEGHAHLAGNVGAALTLDDYKSFRNQWLNARAEGLVGYSPESIEGFYEKLSPGKSDSSVQSNVYSIGYFTVEAMASIKGVDSPIALIKLVSDGATWDDAFLKVYGISWKEAAPILAKTVSRMFLER